MKAWTKENAAFYACKKVANQEQAVAPASFCPIRTCLVLLSPVQFVYPEYTDLTTNTADGDIRNQSLQSPLGRAAPSRQFNQLNAVQ